MDIEANFFKSKLHVVGVREEGMPSHYKFLTSALGSDKISMFLGTFQKQIGNVEEGKLNNDLPKLKET